MQVVFERADTMLSTLTLIRELQANALQMQQEALTHLNGRIVAEDALLKIATVVANWQDGDVFTSEAMREIQAIVAPLAPTLEANHQERNMKP